MSYSKQKNEPLTSKWIEAAGSSVLIRNPFDFTS